jgi:hypothetical protein
MLAVFDQFLRARRGAARPVQPGAVDLFHDRTTTGVTVGAAAHVGDAWTFRPLGDQIEGVSEEGHLAADFFVVVEDAGAVAKASILLLLERDHLEAARNLAVVVSHPKE